MYYINLMKRFQNLFKFLLGNLKMDETEVKKVYLVKTGNKRPKYRIEVENHLEKLSTHCTIKSKKVLLGSGSKLRIIALHPFGGGMYGMNRIKEKIDTINASEFSGELLLNYAEKYARDFAKGQGYKYIGLN